MENKVTADYVDEALLSGMISGLITGELRWDTVND